MNHNLTSENFSLNISLEVFEKDVTYPSNTIMKVSVTSYDFCGKCQMDIDIKDFAQFAVDLRSLYETLKGAAKIEEPYGHKQFISFYGNGRGEIRVSGAVRCDYPLEQELKFENVLDQTHIEKIAKELVATYFKYLK